MKKILFLVLVLGVLIGVAPFGAGFFVEKQAKAAFAAQQNVKVQHEMKRGYETSELVTTIIFNEALLDTTTLPLKGIKINQTIQHGFKSFDIIHRKPVIAKSKSTIQLLSFEESDPRSKEMEQVLKILREYYPKLEIVFLETKWFINGHGQTQFLVPQLKGNIEGIEVKFSGIEGTANHDKGFHKLKASWEMQALQLTQANNAGNVHLEKMTGKHDIYLNQFEQWLGYSEMMLKAFDVHQQDQMLLALKDLSLSSDAVPVSQSDNLDVIFKGQFDALHVKNINLAQSGWTFTLNRLHAPSLRKLELLSQQPNAQNSIEREMDSIGSIMLQQRPKFSLTDVVLKFPEGDVKFDGYVELGHKGMTSINNIEEMIQSIVAEFNFSSPKPIIRSFLHSQAVNEVRTQRQIYQTLHQQSNVEIPDEMKIENEEQTVQNRVEKHLTEILSQSILIEDQNNYTSHIRIEDSQMDMNGVLTPMPTIK